MAAELLEACAALGDGTADEAVRALLRLEYDARVEESGAPQTGRDTLIGVWCAALAALSTGDEAEQLRALAAACSPRVGARIGVRRFVDPVDGATMLLVPGGSLEIGLSAAEAEDILERYGQALTADMRRREANRFALAQPAHTVRLSPYYVERTEVSNARFARFIEAGGYADAALWPGDAGKWRTDEKPRAPAFWGVEHFSGPQLPVTGVSWFEASAYARWAHKALPTEAQWELAARGADGRHFPWGRQWRPGRSATAEHWAKTHQPAEHPDPEVFPGIYPWMVWRNQFYTWTPSAGPEYLVAVDSMPDGASPYGALHMAGNAIEWCRDWVDIHWYRDQAGKSPAPLDPIGPPAMFVRGGKKHWPVQKAARGGDSTMFRAHCRAYVRYQFTPNQRSFTYGFRCVLPAGPRDP